MCIRDSYKTLKGIDHHIDEFGTWTKRDAEAKKKEPTKEIKSKSKFIFPKNFEGYALVAFDEPKGNPLVVDNSNRPIFEISEKGLLKTQAPVKPFEMAKREVSFFEKTEEGTLQELPFLYSLRALKAYDLEGTDKGKKFVWIRGYNQIDRPRVNSILFESEVQNDVLFLSVGTADEIENVWKDMIKKLQENH